MHHITVMSKPDCPLCVAALHTIQKLVGSHVAAVIEEVDITQDQTLLEKYGTDLPVILIDGVEKFRGTFDPGALARLFYDDPAQRLPGYF